MIDRLTEVVKPNEKVVTSERFELIYQDFKRVAFNTLVFSSPLILMALGGLAEGKTVKEIAPLVYAAFLQLAMDLVRKYLTKDKYVVSKK